MDQNVLLDMMELIAEERQLNESLAFSSKDAFKKARFEMAARRDAAAVSDIRRKLARQHDRARGRWSTSKRLFDAYIDTLLDTCFEAARTEPNRPALNGGIPSARPSH